MESKLNLLPARSWIFSLHLLPISDFLGTDTTTTAFDSAFPTTKTYYYRCGIIGSDTCDFSGKGCQFL